MYIWLVGSLKEKRMVKIALLYENVLQMES